MGFSITWFAVPESASETFLQKLGLVETGESEEWPDSPISTAVMETGWRVLWYDKNSCPFLGSEAVAELSRDHEILVCKVEEHCMVSSSAVWRAGQRLWYLHHDGSGGPKGLDIEGSPPDCCASVCAEMERKQIDAGGINAGVDFIFEIPLLVAEQLTGFKHDKEPSAVVGDVFRVLETTADTPAPPTPSPKRGFLNRLFGR